MQSETNRDTGFRVVYHRTNDNIEVSLPTSKSISNRLLVLQNLSRNAFNISGLSDARDTQILRSLLSQSKRTVDVKDAGTAARFGLAWACINNKPRILSGTQRLHQRPMAPLINALKQLGFNIMELTQPGHFPVKIDPVPIDKIGNTVCLKPEVSSQFVSALCLIGPFLPQGLNLRLEGVVPSMAYVRLTLDVMRNLGFKLCHNSNEIEIKPQPKNLAKNICVERDWSSAAFWYEYVALSGQKVLLQDLQLNSIQGDVCCAGIFKKLGVESVPKQQGLLIKKSTLTKSNIYQDFYNCPDLAQPFLFTCAVLGVKCKTTGLQTLKHKETDRVNALKLELQKLNAEFNFNNDNYELNPGSSLPHNVEFESYRDHRMIMAEVMALPMLQSIQINNPQEVKKSYPLFWDEVKKVGIETCA